MTDKPMQVLGIWPEVPGQAPLNQQGEADALYNSGIPYTELRGNVTRSAVILEIGRVKPTIIQFGGHANKQGTLLSDGIAEPGWWGSLVEDWNIELVVLLACETSTQGDINVSDALIRVGVPAVISCDHEIDDGQAVSFAMLLYHNLSQGRDLPTAFKRAKLAVNRKAAEMIRLRQADAPFLAATTEVA